MDALTFYENGVRRDVRNAWAAGATEEAILEALELTALLGVHSLSSHLPALVQEVKAYHQQKVKAG